jgi:hypothetical protein
LDEANLQEDPKEETKILNAHTEILGYIRDGIIKLCDRER